MIYAFRFLLSSLLPVLAVFAHSLLFAQTQLPELVLPIIDRFDLKGVHFIPGKDLMVSHGSDDNLKIWRLNDGRLLHTIKFEEDENVKGFAVEPNGTTWSVVNFGQVVWIDPQQFTIQQSDFIAEEDGIRQMEYSRCVFSSDGKTLYVGGGSFFEIAIWRVPTHGAKLERIGLVATGAQQSDKPVKGIRFMRLTHDGKSLIVGAGGTETWLFNIAGKKFQRLPQLDAHHLVQLADGKLVSVKNSEGKSNLRIFNNAFQSVSAASLPFEVKDLVSFPKSSKCLIVGNRNYYVLDVTVGKVEGPVALPAEASVAAIHQSEELFAVGGVHNEKAFLGVGQIKHAENFREFGYALYQAHKIYANPGMNWLVVAKGSEGHYRTIELTNGNLQMKTHPPVDLIKSASLINNFQGILLEYGGNVRLFNALRPDKQNTFSGMNADFGIELSPRGNYFALLTKNGAFIHDVARKNQPLHLLIKPGSLDENQVLFGTFSPDERLFYGSYGLYNKVYGVRCWEVGTGKVVWDIKESSFEHLRFSTDGKELFCFENGPAECGIRWLDPNNGNTLRRVPLPDIKPRKEIQLMVSPDQSTFLIVDQKTLYNAKTGKLIGKYQPNSVVYGQTLLSNGTYAFFVESSAEEQLSSRIILYDFVRQKELARLYLLEESDDWALITPEGHYDATPEAMKRMYYRRGFETISLEALADRFYFPRLFEHLMRDHQPPSDDDIRKLKSPPVVKLGVPVETRNLVIEEQNALRRYVVSGENVRLTAQAQAPEGNIKEIKLYHDGKLFRVLTRNLVIDDNSNSDHLTVVFDLVLNAGDNSLRAIAFNDEGTASQPDEMVITFKPQVINDKKTKAALHVLAIGINNYKNPRLNLNYAVADASAFVESLKKVSAGLFSEVNVQTLYDNKATRNEIVALLESLKTRAKPQDVFVFYYAGHGVLDTKNRYYIVPHNVTQLYGNDQLLESEAINSTILHNFSTELAAQKQVYFLDACQSAGALSSQSAVRGAAEEKALAQLARSTGTYWIAASGSEQFASEFAQLGHGTFTYALLEALKGNATGTDGSITVKKLDAHIQVKVPELTAKYKGTPQYPASFGFGNDFPIGVIKP